MFSLSDVGISKSYLGVTCAFQFTMWFGWVFMLKWFNDSRNVGMVAVAADVSQIQWASTLVNEKKGGDLIVIAVCSNS